MIKYREPAVLIVQVILPILYSIFGLLMNSLNKGQKSAIDDPLNVSSQVLYQMEDKDYYSYRNLTEGPLTDFDSYMQPSLLYLENAQYLDLLNYSQVAFFNVTKSIR